MSTGNYLGGSTLLHNMLRAGKRRKRHDWLQTVPGPYRQLVSSDDNIDALDQREIRLRARAESGDLSNADIALLIRLGKKLCQTDDIDELVAFRDSEDHPDLAPLNAARRRARRLVPLLHRLRQVISLGRCE